MKTHRWERHARHFECTCGVKRSTTYPQTYWRGSDAPTTDRIDCTGEPRPSASIAGKGWFGLESYAGSRL